jgi:rhamnosyl/mannosyltransferase
LLLKAWSEYIKETKDNSILLIIGDGELVGYYKNMASELGLTSDNTIFKGYVPREILLDCYLASDVFVLPSQDNNEAFGITPIEAMLYGNAIIASDIPGIRGAVRRKNAYISLVPPLKGKRIVDELKYWLSKDVSEYALENYRYVKECFNKEKIKEEVRRLYEG